MILKLTLGKDNSSEVGKSSWQVTSQVLATTCWACGCAEWITGWGGVSLDGFKKWKISCWKTCLLIVYFEDSSNLFYAFIYLFIFEQWWASSSTSQHLWEWNEIHQPTGVYITIFRENGVNDGINLVQLTQVQNSTFFPKFWLCSLFADNKMSVIYLQLIWLRMLWFFSFCGPIFF